MQSASYASLGVLCVLGDAFHSLGRYTIRTRLVEPEILVCRVPAMRAWEQCDQLSLKSWLVEFQMVQIKMGWHEYIQQPSVVEM